MSAFEKLPREVRDMIYKYCLLYDGEIIPYPYIDEVDEIRFKGWKPAKRCIGSYGIERNSEGDLRPCGGITYATDWPSVALLGVSKGIQEEAANILFGMNVWRLSYVDHWGIGEKKTLWYRYQHHFRHITTGISMHEMLRKYMYLVSHEWKADPITSYFHTKGLEDLGTIFMWMHELLVRMSQLKSLVFNFGKFFCPHYSCRTGVLHDFCRKGLLHDFCRKMGRDGPWYRLEVDKKAGRSCGVTTAVVPNIEANRKVDVKVIGLGDDLEKEIFVQRWGLEVD